MTEPQEWAQGAISNSWPSSPDEGGAVAPTTLPPAPADPAQYPPAQYPPPSFPPTPQPYPSAYPPGTYLPPSTLPSSSVPPVGDPSARFRRKRRWGWILMAVSVLVCAGAIVAINVGESRATRLLSSGVKARATVIRADPSAFLATLTVRYRAQGSTHTEDIRFDDDPHRRPGDHIEILYDRNDANSATAHDGDSISPGVLAASSAGLFVTPVLLIVGLVLVRLARRDRKRLRTPPAVAAGWHPDPWRPGGVRWWDGTQWTSNASP